MAAKGEPTEATFRAAVSAYKYAGDKERANATALLQAELKRRAIARHAAFVREYEMMDRAYTREVKDLETKLKGELAEKQLTAAVEAALYKICSTKAGIDPEDALLYAGVLSSFANAQENRNYGTDLEGIAKAAGAVVGVLKGTPTAMRSGGMSKFPRIGKSLYKVSEKQLKSLSENVHASLKEDGIEIPLDKLAKAIQNNVRLESQREFNRKFLKDAFNYAAIAITFVGASVSTVNRLKVLPVSSEITPEPILNCSNYLPDGWFF